VTPLVGNLDHAATPAPSVGPGHAAWCTWHHRRAKAVAVTPGGATQRTVACGRCALRLRRLPVSLVYASTSGVYGDCARRLGD
jgi:hypothetical protein